ncbi:MAG: hypothetical protein J1F14_07200 [Treponema sp.]|nr:hypothetical protein [Treponema sp.]
MKRILSNLKKEAMIMALGAVLAAGSVLGMSCEQLAGNNGNGGNENENPDNQGGNGGNENEENKYGAPTDTKIGDFVLHNFVGESYTAPKATIVEDVNHYLGLAETYINGQVDAFEKSLDGRPEAQAYFADLINSIKNNTNGRFYVDLAYNNNARNIDGIANSISNACSPIMCDIVKNLDNIYEANAMCTIYEILANEAYYQGLGGTREVCVSSYDKEKANIIELAQYSEFFNEQNLDLNAMYENQNFTPITQVADEFYQKAAAKMGNQITKDDLINVTNMALLPWSFLGMDDLTRYNMKHNYCGMNQLSDGITLDISKAIWRHFVYSQQDLGLSR